MGPTNGDSCNEHLTGVSLNQRWRYFECTLFFEVFDLGTVGQKHVEGIPHIHSQKRIVTYPRPSLCGIVRYLYIYTYCIPTLGSGYGESSF